MKIILDRTLNSLLFQLCYPHLFSFFETEGFQFVFPSVFERNNKSRTGILKVSKSQKEIYVSPHTPKNQDFFLHFFAQAAA